MKTLFLMLTTLYFAFASAFADDACFGEPMTKPGVFRVTCTLLAPTMDPKPQIYEFKVDSPSPIGSSDDGLDGLAASPFEVPTAGGGSDTYSFQIYNLAGNCSTTPSQQLRILFAYSPPICEPPVLEPGGEKPAQCDGPMNPHPAGGFGETTPVDGAKLHVDGKNSQLSFSCDGVFTQNR